MDGFTISSSSPIHFFSQSLLRGYKSRTLNIPCRKPRKLSISASKDEPNLDEWDRMELKFGRMIGEDPKLTMAKVMGRKLNPDMSSLEIEKLYKKKKKGKPWHEDIEEIPFELPERKNSARSVQGLNLVRPNRPKGAKFEAKIESFNKDNQLFSIPAAEPPKENKRRANDVTLRKPSRFVEDDMNVNSRFGLKPDSSINVEKPVQKEKFSDITLLKKPEILNIRPESSNENGLSDSHVDVDGFSDDKRTDNEQVRVPETDKGSATVPLDTLLMGKPKRFDSSENQLNQKNGEQVSNRNYKTLEYPLELEKFVATSPIKENEDNDWATAEELVKTGERAEVELISSSVKGFVVR